MILATICALSGNYLGRLIKSRIKILKSFNTLIKDIRSGIEFSKEPVTDIINNLSDYNEDKTANYLKSISRKMNEGLSFTQAWEKELKDNKYFSCLKREDKKMIISFIKGLGTTDVSGQLQHCDTYSEIIKRKVNTLEEDKSNKIKLYNSFGILGAFLIFALLY